MSRPRLAADDSPPLSGLSLSERDFKSLRSLIETRLGISMPESKRAMLETRLIRRLRQLRITNMSAYCRYIESEDGRKTELSSFFDLATTNKTSFFREFLQLEFLKKEAFPTLLTAASSARRPLRLWSAACSTGQEVWTLAIMLERLRLSRFSTADFVVWGSDVSGRVLKTAMAAKYTRSELSDVPPEDVERFFMRAKDPSVDLVRVRPELRKRAGYFQQNLMDSSYRVPTPVDVIFLRNALIYFPREKQQQIVSSAIRYLLPGGLFVVGLTETLHGFPLPLRHCGQSIYQLEAG